MMASQPTWLTLRLTLTPRATDALLATAQIVLDNQLIIKLIMVFTCRTNGDASQILNMFEVVLATMETKLQRVENLDRAVHHLIRKIDTMERTLTSKDAEILAAVLALEKQSTAEAAHVSVKLNQLSSKLDNLCSSGNDVDNDDNDQVEQLVAQPSNRRSRVLKSNEDTQETTMNDVKEVINGIDRRLGFHINIVSEKMGEMTNMVEEVRNAIIEGEDDNDGDLVHDTSTILWLNKINNRTTVGRNKHKRSRSKFDKLLTGIHPLLVVSLYKFDGFITVMADDSL
jgi:hypothetical protein